MSRINLGKSIAGGILAAVVLFGFDFASNNFLLANEWQAVAQIHNLDPALMGGMGALVTLIIVEAILGQLLVLIYAGIRPRFGPGAGTAAIASLMVFVPESALLATFSPWLFSWDFYFRQSAVVLVSLLAAGFAGGWVYAEDEGGQ